MRWVGDRFVVDADAFTLAFDGRPVDLEPQAMDLLLYLLEHRDQMLTKEVLLDDVWGDQFVGESALTTRIKQLRRALGDDGRSQHVIKTVHGKGYRFVASVDAVDATGDSPPTHDGTSPADSPRTVAPAGDDPAQLSNIPPMRTRLIGRRSLVSSVAGAVADWRLVTLVGFGGAGKTSVACEVGRTITTSFTEGVWFVDLIPVQNGAGIDGAVARAIGVPFGAGSGREDLLRHLAHRDLLLVIDNCEHVADATADFCSDLLDSTFAPRVLATSRIPLHVMGERRIAVGPLPVVDDDGGAIDLLDEVAARMGVTVPSEDRMAALELCSRVDGLPLAIELVGARLATMSVREIVDRLDRLGVAATSDRRPERHAALATVLADTVATLDPDDVRLLTLLSRLEGSFGIDEVEGIGAAGGVGDTTGAFVRLVDRSLLVSTSTSPRRHAVLETVRQHAAANDADARSTADAHAAWCLDELGESLPRHYYDLRRADWVSGRFDDIVVAHDHLAAAGRSDEAIRLLSAMALAVHLDDGSRARRILRRLDEHHPADDPVVEARRHCTGVMAAMAARSPEGMREHGLAAVDAADATDDASLRGLARVLRSWEGVLVDPEQALRDVDEAITLARSADDADTELFATGYKVFHLSMSLRFDQAVEEGFAALERIPHDPASHPRQVLATGLVSTLVLDDPRAALRLDDQLRPSIPSTFWGTQIVRAAAQATLGAFDEAVAAVRELEKQLDRIGISPLPDLLLVPATVAHCTGDQERAGRYLCAIRSAPRPTQSLMVSTAYRVMRSHVEFVDPGAATSDVWDEARTWLLEVAESGG